LFWTVEFVHKNAIFQIVLLFLLFKIKIAKDKILAILHSALLLMLSLKFCLFQFKRELIETFHAAYKDVGFLLV
jgi:hypothetical protein